MRPGLAVIVLWVGWLASWIAAAAWQKTTVKRVSAGAEIRYRLVLIIGALVLGIPARRYAGPLRLYRANWGGAWVCIGFIALGIVIAWWARIHLGSLWSGSITRKEDHRVVDTGPYRFVRHPIYTGLLVAVFATAAIKGTIPGFLGAIIITVGLWMKARTEEQWLREELGAEAYDSYRRRVPMLVPFLLKQDRRARRTRFPVAFRQVPPGGDLRGVRSAWYHWHARIAHLPRLHELWEIGVGDAPVALDAERGGQPAVHQDGPRTWDQLLRHGERVLRRRQRDRARPRDPGFRATRRSRDRHESEWPDAAGREWQGAVAEIDSDGGR